MTGKAIGCAAGCSAMFVSSDRHDEHLALRHGTTYELATGSELTQAECDYLRLDGRDGTGTYTLSDLTDTQRSTLYRWRNR